MKISRILKNKIKYFLNGKLKRKFIFNINKDFTQNQKEVLISYITSFAETMPLENSTHPNRFEALQIIKFFINNNYTIDVIDCNSKEYLSLVKHKKYDVIFGFGETFYEISKNNPKAKKIMYITENHPDFSFKKEKERVDYFKKRHKKNVKLARSGIYYKNEHFSVADYFIIMGRQNEFLQYNKKIYDINPTGLINKEYKFKEKNHTVSKKNFLWLGSNGAIHKGLDLLIDIFSKRDDITLHICGLNRKDKHILKIPNKKNIIEYGRINVNSNQFLNLVDKCSFIILPSCSEGMSTSILTGMLHGLIPIVTKNSGGLDKLKDKALYLEDYKINYVENRINEFINFDTDFLKKMQYEVFNYSRKNFQLINFKENFYKIMNEILSD